ncbi:hypothetical protein BCR33DRAFT_722019 [Rhizoclosmatium globosum]|uniref:DUF952 domain-containing protein n=1 Tax=Rhizoclosmatium globosum TaxID=329046 RepID=A0A1Y2BP34_9FUNG|nr:hypothetical protein BCR33DRAFT_722019 [Rhizoclosmatium globosum]|eukprot:ORY36508.1 hypothetical protein BCR33DRAFT_722019 [Rhizoclosmatium globosum]
MTSQFVYKILTTSQWPIDASKAFPTPIDERDNFVHLSTAVQAHRVASLFYSNEKTIIILTIPVANIKEGELVWEAPVHPAPIPGQEAAPPSTELYPHLYGKLTQELIGRVTEVSQNAEGKWEFTLE